MPTRTSSIGSHYDRAKYPSLRSVHLTAMPKTQQKLHVFMTIIGRKGGMDHIAYLTIETIKRRTDLDIEITTLTTRGSGNIAIGAFAFAVALLRFVIAGLRGRVDLLHLN